MKTLNGAFSRPKPIKRNFIQENVRQLRDSQKHWISPEGNEPCGQVAKTKIQKMQRPQLCAGQPPHITSGSKLKQSELMNGTTKIRNTKSANVAPKGIAGYKPSHSRQSKLTVLPDKNLKLGRKTKTKIGLKNEKEDEVLKNNDVAIYVRQQRESIKLHQQNANGSNSDSNSSLSSADSITFLKPPTGQVTQRTTASQTLDPSNLETLYREGTIRYPSASLKQAVSKTKLVGPCQNQPVENLGIQLKKLDISKSMPVKSKQVPDGNKYSKPEKIDLDQLNRSSPECSEVRQENDTNFVQMNAKAIASLSPRSSFMKTDPSKPPATYQRGVLPKYLKKRQGEWQKDTEQKEKETPDPACPPGHVCLPDPERKETLKMLRKSYADLVQELNMLPVRTDTLRIRQRKMELEKQLNKLEEGIKVFSRPKVYVKIGE